MKLINQILLLILIFCVSAVFFTMSITEKTVSAVKETMVMEESGLPIVTMQVDGKSMNALHGYASNLDEMLMRESITPLGADRIFTVLIDEKNTDVKKLKYEILDEAGQEVEVGSVFILEPEEGSQKSVTIQLQETLGNAKEYIVKLTLITSTSKRIYYFTRFKVYDNRKLEEKLNFVEDFHKTLFDKEAAESLRLYLEPNPLTENESLANVNINSSFDLVTWGALEPEILYKQAPTITEFYDSMISVRLDYIVSAKTNTGIEHFQVKEYFRFNYSDSRTYLYNYERKMETLFDVNNTSLMKAEFKLGITNEPDIEIVSDHTNQFLSFVYGRELFVYNIKESVLTKVFSFRREQPDYARDLYDNHNIRILQIDEKGNVDFIVYGYMNRGEYEGRVGILLYQYLAAEGRIEEQLYLPFNCSYPILEEELTPFLYKNEVDVFYFNVFQTIYAYNLVTKSMKILSKDAPANRMIYQKEGTYIAWQDTSDDEKATRILLYDLETGEETDIKAPKGNQIRLLGKIDENLIYGYVRREDSYVHPDGKKVVPVYRVLISNKMGEVLKTYEQKGIFITEVETEENIVTLKRVKPFEHGYASVADDFILNQNKEETTLFHITTRVTDLMLTEYYISMPEGAKMEKIPDLKLTHNTIITQDTTVRISESEERKEQFYAYSFGSIIYTSLIAGDVVLAADTKVGTAMNQEGKVIWERGVKGSRMDLSTMLPISHTGANSTQAVLSMVAAYKNMEVDVSTFDSKKMKITEWMKEYLKVSPLDLTGATLDEVLYFVYQKRPVLAYDKNETAMLIVGYDAAGISVIEPVKGLLVTYPLKDAVTLFSDAGNRFYSYVE